MKKDLFEIKQTKRKEKYFCIKCNRSYGSKKSFTRDKKEHEDVNEITRFYL